MRLSRNAKKLVALTLTAALVVGGIAVNGSSASAAKKKATLKLNKKSAKVTVGKKVTLKVKKKNVKSAKITWKSSKKAVASVNKKGVVTGKKAGTAKISATIKYKMKGSKKTKKKTLKCTVKVVKKSVVASKAPAPTKAPDGNATAVPTKAPGGDATAAPTKEPGGEVTPTKEPGGEVTPTKEPGGEVTPTKEPGGEVTPTKEPGEEVTPTKEPGGEDTPTPEPVVAGKWYSGSYSATLTKDGENEAEITDSTLDANAPLRVKDAVSFGIMTNGGIEQPALLIDCSKLITTGFTTPAISITVSPGSNVMCAESLDATGWTWKGNVTSYTASVDTTKDVYAVYLGDKSGEVTLSVSVLDAGDLPEVVTENIPSTITLKSGDTTTVGLEYAANEYTYKSDSIRVFNTKNYADYAGVTCEYSETDKQLSIAVPSDVTLDKTNTRIEYSRIYANADGKEYSLMVSFGHVDDSIKVLTLESSWKAGWSDELLVSPATLKAAGLTADNLVGSKITFTNGDAGTNFDMAFKSGGNPGSRTLFKDFDWLNPNDKAELTLTADHSDILTNGIYVGLSVGTPASILLELAN